MQREIEDCCYCGNPIEVGPKVIQILHNKKERMALGNKARMPFHKVCYPKWRKEVLEPLIAELVKLGK